MKKSPLKLIPLFALLVSQAFANGGTTVNSLEVVKGTMTGVSNCLHYKVTGLCFWLRCSPTGCHVENTLKVSHYLPDAVITVYTRHNNNPWNFVKTIVDPPAFNAGQWQLKQFDDMKMGSGEEHDNSSRDLDDRFHEVDIIGAPALAVLNKSPFLLKSSAEPDVPYYSSLLDAQGWRFPGIERFYPGSQIPGIDEIGTFVLHDWGGLYPRNGFVNQPDDAKAGAVDALRAATIITRKNQPHIYKLLPNTCGKHCKIDGVKENSKNTQFQMIYPKIENQCVVFGKSDAVSLHSWEINAAVKGHDRYIWILWRHYHGCLPDKGAVYLRSVNL